MTKNTSISYDKKSDKVKCPFCINYDWLDNTSNNKKKISRHCLRTHNFKLSEKIPNKDKKKKVKCQYCNKIHDKNNVGKKATKCLE